MYTRYTVECDRNLKLYVDLIEVLGLLINITVLKVKVKVRVSNFGGQLEHGWSLSLEFLEYYTVDDVIKCDRRESVEVDCVVEVLQGERLETLALSSLTLLTIGLCRFPMNLSCSSHWPTSPWVGMSLKVFNRLVQTSDTEECNRNLNMDDDLS